MDYTHRHPIYIWQIPEWPNFSWDYARLTPILGRIRQLQGELIGAMATLGFEVRDSASLSAISDDIISSSAIEGVVLNADSVRSSVAKKLGLNFEGNEVYDHYVEGLVDVMVDATRHSDVPLSAERLFDWHAALFPLGRSGMYKITVADWRKGEEPMQVVSGAMGHEKIHYEAPPSDRVPGEMDKFLEWASQTCEDPVVCAAVAHLWFVTIHPFDDGNGRISRTIADYFLSKTDGAGGRFYSMSAEILREKKSYYEVLESSQKGTLDITEWIEWFLLCLEKALLRSGKIVRHTVEKGIYWEKFRSMEINERQRKIINRLWDGFDGKLTSSKWAKICHCSQDTALRDIHDLINKGMLRDSGEKGRSANYLLT